MRCLGFGLAGLVPGFGVALAWQALALFRNVAEENGERFRLGFPISLFLVSLLSAPFWFLAFEWSGAVMFLLFTLAALAISMARAFHASAWTKWNPARHWAWAGGALGIGGLMITAFFVEGVYVSAYFAPLLGLR